MPRPLRIALFATACVSTDVLAVGFALEHQSVSNMGYSFAGGAGSAEDASTIFWNPAGMTRLPGRQAVVGLNAIYGRARFNDQGTTSPAGPAFPITGGNGGNPVGLNWVPNLYYATDVTSNVKAGIGINSPFGLKTKYPSDWMGRYQAIDSVLKSLNINPSVAWKVNGTRLVLWFNEHFGEIKTAEGKPFTETQAYKQCAGKLAGAVTLYRRNTATYGEDIRKLNTKRHTVAQALASADYSLMEKQRIKTFSRDVFGQLKGLAW